MWWLYPVIGVLALFAGFLIGYAYRRNVAEAKIAKAEDAVKKLYDDAQRRAEEIKKEKILEAKEEVFKVRSEAERENRERRGEIQRNERRIFQREEVLDKKTDALEKREAAIAAKEAEVEETQAAVRSLHDQQLHELEKISGMSMDAAREMLLANVERDARHDAAILIRDIESKTKEEADKRAQHHFTGDSALRGGPCGGGHRIGRAASQR